MRRRPVVLVTIASPLLAAGLLFVAAAIIYVPEVGHGFVKDDFGWVGRSRLTAFHDLYATLTSAPSGFFRPAVSLSFGVNRWVCGLSPLCYGQTNFLLFIGCAAGIFALARALSLPRGGALTAAALWAFNWHGINMAVLWISGRTALVAVLLSVGAATLFARRHVMWAIGLAFAAMLAKEEAVLVPAILLAWAVVDRWARVDETTRRGLSYARMALFLAGALAAEGMYFWLRSQSGAITPATAPPFYRLSFTISMLARNAPAYLDRAATFVAVVTILGLIACRGRRMVLSRSNWSLVGFGTLWFLGTIAITVFLPVRSSLYACLPSVGAALVGAAVLTDACQAVPPHRLRWLVVAGLALPFLLWPVYHARNRPSVREAELSARTIEALQRVAAARGEGTVVLVADDRAGRPSLNDSFGTLLQDAADVVVTPRIRVWIDPPPVDAALAGLESPPPADVILRLQGGALTQVP